MLASLGAPEVEQQILSLAPLSDTSFHHAKARCAPCGCGRAGAGVVGLLVPLIIALTFVPFVLENQDLLEGRWTSVVDVSIFLLLLLMLLASWLQTMFTDPGTTPIAWHEWISRQENARGEFRMCHRTNLYRPPRSHFDSVTRRVVLNMDHFCPWVVNCVGFYNKKFFVLFLIYTSLTTSYACVSALLWHNDQAETGAHLLGISNLLGFSCMLNGVLACTISLFAGFHIKMILCNETSVEPGRGLWGRSKYNVGWRANLESVAGANPWLWLVPVYGNGPVHDGIKWPTTDDKENGLPVGAGWLRTHSQGAAFDI